MKMLVKAAICDDEISVCNELEAIIEGYAEQKKIAIEIGIFYTGEALCKNPEIETFDVIFLDIELERMNGIEVGRFIRNELKNPKIQIIYISGKQLYAMELFKVQPFDFLIKPLNSEMVSEVLGKLFERMENEKQYFVYRAMGAIYRVPFSEILYICSDKRKIVIQTVDGKKEYYGKLSVEKEKLPTKSFIQIGKSYYVHEKYIRKYQYECVEMMNGEIFSISKSYRTAVRKEILECMR